MKRLIALGALVLVILLSYFLFELTGLAVGAMIVAIAVISYRVAGATGLIRAILLITLILSFVIGAVLTPPDIVTQVFMAMPLLLLYNLSIFFSFLLTRKRNQDLGTQTTSL